MDVSGKDYAFYANYLRRAQESELREGFDQDIGRVKDTWSDEDSVASGHVSAYFVASRGKVRDDNDDDDEDEESVGTDDDSDEEETLLDDQSHVIELTTYWRDRNSSSDDTRLPPANMVTGSYKFRIRST